MDDKELVPGTRAEIEQTVDRVYEAHVRELAQEEMPESIKVLATLRDDEDVNASVRRGAANDLIDHGFEKNLPGGIKGAIARGARGGITINQINFTIEGGEMPKLGRIEEALEVLDADVDEGSD